MQSVAPDDPRVRSRLETLFKLIGEAKAREGMRRFHSMYPDETTMLTDGTVMYARSLYPKHMEFLAAGATYRERCALCANRVGKTFGMGGYEMTAHLTGLYPHWWAGRRFTKPVRGWAAGKTNETTRDIVQTTLLGDVTGAKANKGVSGTGLIPGLLVGNLTWKAGVPDLIDTVRVKHASGGWSVLGLKSYQQGRGSFEGVAQDVIWLDEEPEQDVYGECIIRTATTNGIVMITFTPLEGMSEVVMSFLPGEHGIAQLMETA